LSVGTDIQTVDKEHRQIDVVNCLEGQLLSDRRLFIADVDAAMPVLQDFSLGFVERARNAATKS
jgi:hypothetical protein